jgi:hypothetical protein
MSTEARAAPTFGALDTGSSFDVDASDPATGAAVVCLEVFPAGAEVVAAESEPASLAEVASDTGVSFAGASLELPVEGAVTTSLELPVEGAVTTTSVVLDPVLDAVSLAGTVTFGSVALVAVLLAVAASVVLSTANEEESRATKQNTTCASCMVTEVVDQQIKSPSRRCGG